MTNEEFFRRCWLTLKAATIAKKQNRLRLQMDEIEFVAGGVSVRRPSPKKSEAINDEPDRSKEEITPV